MLINMKMKRIKNGYSQKKLSQITNVSLIAISNLESGKTNPQLAQYGTLLRISNALDISVEELIKENDVV